MNKRLSTKFTDGIRETLARAKSGFTQMFEDYDMAATPAFIIFMLVVTAGLTVNYFFLAPKVGAIEAIAVSLLFEIGILFWKFQSHRTKNSEAQDEIVNWAKWLSVLFAFLMLVSSLTEKIFWGWVVAGASLTHVICYLLFDQNDEIRNNKRKNRMANERQKQKTINSNNAIQEAETDLQIIHKIVKELDRLRAEYKHLPIDELEFVLEATRTRLLKEYKASDAVSRKTAGAADVNKDGKIGGTPQLTRAFASEVEAPKASAGNDQKPPHPSN